MAKGYPTPDNPIGDVTFSCIPVYVPSNPEFEGIFAAAIYGLYSSMSKEYFWRETGSMSAQEAAFLASRGLAESQAYDGLCGGGEVSCLDVADCIETDETVQEKLTENFSQNAIEGGYMPNPETSVTDTPQAPTLSDADKAASLLPEGFDCTTQKALAMGLARTIVRELHETSEDFIELLEYATNTLEAWSNVTSVLPSALTSVITVALDWIDWILETLSELYMAAYTQDVEDELACAIYCALQTDCSLSLSELEAIYADEATVGTPPDDLIEVLEFIYDVAVSADKIAVAAFHYQILRLISWGKFASFSAPYLKSILKSAQGSDYSYEDLCDGCETETPTDYWRLLYDFRVSKFDTDVFNNQTLFQSGYVDNQAVAASILETIFKVTDLGAQYSIKAVAAISQRRGSTGSGTNDIQTITVYTGANLGGSGSTFDTLSGITDVSNELIAGQIKASPTASIRSLAFTSRVNKATSSPDEKLLRTYEISVIGLAGAGDTKPSGAHWFGDIPPATLVEMFE